MPSVTRYCAGLDSIHLGFIDCGIELETSLWVVVAYSAAMMSAAVIRVFTSPEQHQHEC